MGKFFKGIGSALKTIGKTAAKNAIADPRTTIAGVTGIIGGVSVLTSPTRDGTSISAGIIGILGGISLVLADDPKSTDKDIDNEQKPTN